MSITLKGENLLSMQFFFATNFTNCHEIQITFGDNVRENYLR